MDAQVFISFASEDHKVATTLCSALESRGFKCWISSRDILPGENFQVAIVRAIRNAKMMLLVFTANSNNSEEMNKELALASQRKLAVVPLRIDDVTPNDAFRYEFATRQWVDFFADWEKAMNQLTAQIAHLVGGPAPASATSPMSGPTSFVPASVAATAAPRAKGSPVGLFVALGVVIVLLLGGVLAMQLLGRKSAASASGPAPAATAVADAPIDAVPLPPPSQAPAPSPAPSPQPAVAVATPAVVAPQPPRSPVAKSRAVVSAAPRLVRHARATQAPDEGDAAPARRSNVPDEGDEAPH